MGMNGHDQASYQNGLRESKVPGDFIIIKSTQGLWYENPYWKTDANETLESNKLLGLYHYSEGTGAKDEANYFYTKVKPYIGRAVLALDWESGSNKSFNSGMVNYCLTFLDELVRLSKVDPIIYMSEFVTKSYDWTPVAKKYKLWVASYGKNDKQIGYKSSSELTVPTCGAWGKNVSIYQYTSNGYLENWGKALDLNHAYLTREEWKKMATPKTETTAKTESIAKAETTKYYRDVVVKNMVSWLGKSVSDGSHEAIVDLYNTISPLPVSYKVKYTDAWCATTVSAAFHKAGYNKIFPLECSCPRMITKAKEMGIWVENDKYVPNIGDCVLYDWEDSGSGDNTGNPDHIGMVEKVSGDTITVIEGNMGYGYVGRRNIKVNGKYIRGYVTPKFTSDTEAKPTTSTSDKGGSSEKDKSTANDKLTTAQIKTMQVMLNACGYSCGSVDGKLGTKTLSAIKKFQEKVEIKVDGIYGSITKSKLEAKYKNVLKKLSATSKTVYGVSNKTEPNKTKMISYGKVVNAPDKLNVRTGAGTSYKKCTFSPLGNGTKVEVFDAKLDSKGNNWYYVKYGEKFGFASSSFISLYQ